MNDRTWIQSITLAVASLLIANVNAQEPPFVAGWQRFADHGEIDSVAGGRLLISELSCAACHSVKQPALQPKLGPDLKGAGAQLSPDWVRRFIAAPHETKPGTTMPHVLGHMPEVQRTATVDAIVEFLKARQATFPVIQASGASAVPHQFWRHGDPSSGRKLFHRIGCVACHEPGPNYETVKTQPTALDQMLEQFDPKEIEEMGLAAAVRRVESVPLSNLSEKYSAQSLAHFLLDPHRTRESGRMPKFDLNVMQAADIAAWLAERDTNDGDGANSTIVPEFPAAEIDSALAAKGRALFAKLGCANCHSADDVKPTLSAKSLDKLRDTDTSCLNSGSGLPEFHLDEAQRRAVVSVLRNITSGSEAIDAQALARHTLLQFNCFACHARDKLGGVGRFRKAYFETFGNIDIGDEGRLPPPLTGVGHKLLPRSLQGVFNGKGKLRPHMTIQMPGFPKAATEVIPKQLEQADRRVEQSESTLFPLEDGQMNAGRALLDTGCVSCHSLKGNTLPGVVGVELADVTSRIRPQWFHDFLLNPAHLKPGTRMPSFFPDGEGQLKTVYDGNAERQISALWHYLKQSSKQPLPAKLEKSRSLNYELIPNERPLVLRTFMKDAGTHAIAVGLPDEINFAFDAEQVRLATAWKGRFLDAQGTWFVRFAPPAEPLGNKAVLFPEKSLLVSPSEQKAEPRADSKAGFLGYRLDSKGVPTFLYQMAGCRVEDRMAVNETDELVRNLTIRRENSDQTIWMRPLSGKTFAQKDDFNMTAQDGLRVSVDGLPAGEVRRNADGFEWMFPLPTKDAVEVELRYQW